MADVDVHVSVGADRSPTLRVPIVTAAIDADGICPMQAVWERIRVRLERLLHGIEVHAQQLLDRPLDPPEVAAAIAAADALAAAFASLTLPAVARLARSIPDELEPDRAAHHVAGVRIAATIEDVRVLFASAIAEQRQSSVLDGVVIVAGTPSARLDTLMWVLARHGHTVRHASVLLPEFDPESLPVALIIDAGPSHDDELLSLCRAVGEQADTPIIVVLDGAACGGAWARALAMAATTIVPSDLGFDAVAVELLRLRAHRSALLRALVCGTVDVARLRRRRVDVQIVPDPDHLMTAARSGGAVVFGADVPASLVMSSTRLLRSTPATRNLPVWAVVPSPSEVFLLRAAGIDLDVCPEIDEVVAVSIVRQLRSLDGEVEIDALDSGAQLSWPATGVLIDRALIAAHRSRAPLSVVTVDAVPGQRPEEERARHRDLIEMLRHEFRRGDVTGARETGRFVVALHGMARSAAATRMENLVNRFGLDGGGVRIGVAQFPTDGRSTSSLVAAADAAVALATAHDGPIVTTTSWRPDAGAVADVVVVDADPVVAAMIATALEREGISADIIDDGLAVFDHLRTVSLPPRVVVLDVDAPLMGGVSVLRDLWPTGALGRTAIVITSQRSSEADTRRALELGAVDVILKPLNVTALTNRVRRLLEHEA